MRGLEISDAGGHASILVIFHSVAEKISPATFWHSQRSTLAPSSKKKNPAGKSKRAET